MALANQKLTLSLEINIYSAKLLKILCLFAQIRAAHAGAWRLSKGSGSLWSETEKEYKNISFEVLEENHISLDIAKKWHTNWHNAFITFYSQ